MNPKPRDMGLLKTKYPFLDSPKAVVQKLFQEFFLYTSSEPQTAVYNIVMRFLKVRVMWVFYWVWVFFFNSLFLFQIYFVCRNSYRIFVSAVSYFQGV